MADKSLKGITVEIGGDTTDLSNALKEVNNQSRTVGTELSQVNRLLRFNPESIELLAQRETLLNQQIELTSTRLRTLRTVESQVTAQFEEGDLGEAQFRAFQREIIAAEGRLQHFEGQARENTRNVREAFRVMGDGVKGAIMTAVAGEGLKEVVSQAIEAAHLQTQIKVGFDVPPEGRKAINDAVTSIQAYGVDGEEALSAVRKQWALNGDQSSAVNQKIIQQAGMISTTYQGIDLNELIQETYEMSKGLGMSQEQAMGMTNALLKMGFPPDQLDIITEYGQQLNRAGFSAGQIQNIFAAGIKTGDWNIDALLDGLKEGRLRMAAFGTQVNTSTQTLLKGTGISTTQLQSWGKAVAGGGQAGQQAMQDVAKALSGVSDKTKQNALGVAIFGTKWEDSGKKIMDAIGGASGKAADLSKNVKQMGDDTKTLNADPMVAMNKALGDLKNQFIPLLTSVAQFVTKIAEWVEKNPQLAATITGVVIGIGILVGILGALGAALGFVEAVAAPLEIGVGALIGIFALFVIGIIAVIAIGIELHNHWKEIMAWAKDLAHSIVQAFDDWKAGVADRMHKSESEIKNIWNGVMNFFKGINLAKIGRDIINGLIGGITSMATKAWDAAKNIATGIGKAISKAVGRSSPAKMTIAIGEDIGAGMMIGLNNTTDRIQSASNQMAQSALPEVPANNIQNQTIGGKSLVVNITSPKALDVREANRQFNQTLKKLALQW
jgi:phage-related minor tail protein